MKDRHAKMIIIGAGIAGAAAAYFAAQRGFAVTLIDAGQGTASLVPTALINPVRGRAGKIIDGGASAARFTFSLVSSLLAAGHVIPHGLGLWRPVPDLATRQSWQEALAKVPDLPHSWHEVPFELGLKEEWHSALFLPESGWLETAPFLAALISASGAKTIKARVIDHPRCIKGEMVVTLENGETLTAERALWCGGALGATQNHLGRATFRPGSFAILNRQLSPLAMSFGLYSAPFGGASVAGPTREPRSARYDDSDNPRALAALATRIDAMWREGSEIASHFRGVRLEAAPDEPHCESLTGFGGRGFLLAPISAARWAAAL